MELQCEHDHAADNGERKEETNFQRESFHTTPLLQSRAEFLLHIFPTFLAACLRINPS